jgi:four helix bundle protein
MNYEEWERDVAEEIRQDALWKMTAYRMALFMSDLGWRDTAKLIQDRRMLGLSDQLVRALGSISANLAEGYSRGTGRDRARFYEYALGSARESRDWYFKARHVLGDQVCQHRLGLLTRIIQLLIKTVPQQRGRNLREQPQAYPTDPADDMELRALLRTVPLPNAPSARRSTPDA